jgi:hypothetical protein
MGFALGTQCCRTNSLGDIPTRFEKANVKALRLLKPMLCATDPTECFPSARSSAARRIRASRTYSRQPKLNSSEHLR